MNLLWYYRHRSPSPEIKTEQEDSNEKEKESECEGESDVDIKDVYSLPPPTVTGVRMRVPKSDLPHLKGITFNYVRMLIDNVLSSF